MPAAGKRKSSDGSTSLSIPKSRKSLKDSDKTGDNSADEEEQEVRGGGARGGELVYAGVTDFKSAKGKMTDNIIWEFSRLSCFQGEEEIHIQYDILTFDPTRVTEISLQRI